MKAVLEKISSNENAIRTQGPIDGFCDELPTKGRSFYFYSNPIDPTMDLRRITTSKVMSTQWAAGLEETGVLTFSTLNSQYRLRIKEKVK